MPYRFSSFFQGRLPRELPAEGLKPAAVLLLLVGDEGDERVIFQLRTHNVRFHKGEISLPGGRLDEEDASYLAAALRETHEEIGVPPDAVEVLGALDDVEARGSGYLVRPYVGVLRGDIQPTIAAPREVALLLAVPLAHLLDEDTRVWHAADVAGTIQTSLAYAYEEHVIWGVTGRILDQFVGMVVPGTVGGGER